MSNGKVKGGSGQIAASPGQRQGLRISYLSELLDPDHLFIFTFGAPAWLSSPVTQKIPNNVQSN